MDRFEIETTATHIYWAERQGDRIRIHRTNRSQQGEDEVLLQWDIDVLRNLLMWAKREGPEIVYMISGPLAHQVRELSRELSLTPEMFVWHAVKVFIEVGQMSEK